MTRTHENEKKGKGDKRGREITYGGKRGKKKNKEFEDKKKKRSSNDNHRNFWAICGVVASQLDGVRSWLGVTQRFHSSAPVSVKPRVVRATTEKTNPAVVDDALVGWKIVVNVDQFSTSVAPLVRPQEREPVGD